MNRAAGGHRYCSRAVCAAARNQAESNLDEPAIKS